MHFPSKEEAITFFLRTPSLLRLVNPLVVFISKWQSFKKCSRAAQNALEGRMRPAGRSLPTPSIDVLRNWTSSLLEKSTIEKSFIRSI